MATKKSEWSEEAILQLIEEYRKQELLWNPNNLLFHNNLKKNDAWEHLGMSFKCKGIEINKKMDSLLSSFRRERQKCKTHSGDGVADVYNSSWFAYKHMQFLMDKFTPRKTVTNAVSENQSMESNVIIDNYSVNNIPVDESTEEILDSDVNENTTKEATATATSFSTQNKRKRKNNEDPRISEAYNILKSTVANKLARDESTVFGEHVANKHRKYDIHTKSIVEHKINNILYEADMGNLTHPHHAYFVNSNLSPSHSSTLSSYTLQTPLPSPYNNEAPETSVTDSQSSHNKDIVELITTFRGN